MKQYKLDNPDIFYASYSVLSAWERGDAKGALQTYFNLSKFTSKEMEQGTKLHNEWEIEVNKTGKLPKVFGAKPLIEPKTEIEAEVRIGKINLKARIDLLHKISSESEKHAVCDYKTGVQGSAYYINTQQLPVYALICTLQGIEVGKGVIYYYNQYSKEVETYHMFINKDIVKNAYAWVTSNSNAMHEFMKRNDVWNRLKEIEKNGGEL